MLKTVVKMAMSFRTIHVKHLRGFLSIALRIPTAHDFASLARANECVHAQNVRDFSKARLDSEIKARFLLNEHGDLIFLLHNIVPMLSSLI